MLTYFKIKMLFTAEVLQLFLRISCDLFVLSFLREKYWNTTEVWDQWAFQAMSYQRWVCIKKSEDRSFGQGSYGNCFLLLLRNKLCRPFGREWKYHRYTLCIHDWSMKTVLWQRVNAPSHFSLVMVAKLMEYSLLLRLQWPNPLWSRLLGCGPWFNPTAVQGTSVGHCR